MGRPSKNTVDYFPHDARASDGDTLTILDGQFGNDGYAFWFKLLERLSSAENHFIDVRNSVKWQVFLAKSHFTQEKAALILNLLSDLGAIDSELWHGQGLVWSQNLVDRIGDAYRNRKVSVPQKPVSNNRNSVSDAINPVSDTGNPQKKRKGKERKIKRNIRAQEEIELPDWIERKTWEAYLEMRRVKGKPPTKYALEQIARSLTAFREQGQDPNSILNESIINNWTGVFPLKNGGNNGRTGINRGNHQTTEAEFEAGLAKFPRNLPSVQ